MVDVSAQFSEFLDNIKLGEKPRERIESAISGASTAVASALGIEPEDVIVQGSYANGTAIEPVNGSYDVDIVLPCIDRGTGAVAALDAVEDAYRSNKTYSDKVCEDNRNRCVRLNYASDSVGDFHVDVVPVRPAGPKSGAPLEAPSRNKKAWNDTAPAEYTHWAKYDVAPTFAATVMTLKRWRDETQTDTAAIKSIILQVLVAQHLSDEPDHAGRVASTLRNIADDLSWRASPPVIPNPVLESEDLSERWTETSFKDFQKHVAEAADQAEVALNAEDLVAACDAWRNLLGPDFPEFTAEEYGIELSDSSHAQSYRAEGWTRAANPVELVIQAHKARPLRPDFRPRPYDGGVLNANSKWCLRFQTLSPLPENSIVKWQIVNTGPHAHADDGGRGDFYDSNSLLKAGIRQSPRATASTWEGLEYTGVHLIRAVAIRDNIVVAESQWLNVTIRSKSFSF